MHLLTNMWFLWIFGNNVEDRLGHLVYAVFYVLGGLFAVMLHWVMLPDSEMPVVGASGAVAAVLGAYAITFPTARVRALVLIFLADVPAFVFLGIWFLIQLWQGLQGMQEGVAWWAHVGGFAAGLILMPLLSLGSSASDQDWRRELEEAFSTHRDE